MVNNTQLEIQDYTYGNTWDVGHADSGQEEDDGIGGNHRLMLERIGHEWEYSYGFPGDLIGQGGFGTVFKATVADKNNKNEMINSVAVKKTKLSNAHIKQMRQNKTWDQNKELWSVLVTLQHPNVVSYFTIVITKLIGGAEIDFGMEFCDGGDLSAFIEQCTLGKHELSLSLVVSYARQIADGLHFLHQNQFIHGDLKPGNILIKSSANSRQLLIGDLDSAVQLRDHITDSGSSLNILFTVTYMSPELARRKGGERIDSVDAKTDVWSLGCIILDLVDCCFKIHERYFYKENGTQRLDRIRRRDYQPMPFLIKLVGGYVPYIAEEIPEYAAEIVRVCFKNVTDRVTSETLLRRLQETENETANL